MQALWMILASLMFSCMGVCVKLGSATLTTAELTFFRGFVGILMMLPVLLWQKLPVRSPVPRMQLTRGLSGCVALMCYFHTLGALPLATAVTLSYTSPLFVALLLAWWFREQVRPQTFGAITLGLIGVILLLKPTITPQQLPAALVGLCAGLISSIAYVSVRELGRAGEPEARTVLYFSGVISAAGLAWIVLSGGFSHYGTREILCVAGIGGFGGVAQLAMTRAYRLGKTLISASLAYTTVIFSSLAGVVIWDEVLPVAAWMAIALIIASGVLVSWFARRTTPS